MPLYANNHLGARENESQHKQRMISSEKDSEGGTGGPKIVTKKAWIL
jgi:hypothetical protein